MAARKNVETEAAGVRHLDLDAEESALSVQRMQVKVGGAWRTLRGPDDLALAEKELLRVLLLEHQELAQNPGLDTAARRARKEHLDGIEAEMIDLALLNNDLSDAEIAGLHPFYRSRIIELFTRGLGDTLLPIAFRVVREAGRRQQQAIRLMQAEQANQTSPQDGAPQPETDDATASSPMTSSSDMAAG